MLEIPLRISSSPGENTLERTASVPLANPFPLMTHVCRNCSRTTAMNGLSLRHYRHIHTGWPVLTCQRSISRRLYQRSSTSVCPCPSCAEPWWGKEERVGKFQLPSCTWRELSHSLRFVEPITARWNIPSIRSVLCRFRTRPIRVVCL